MGKIYFLNKAKYWFSFSTILICFGLYYMTSNFITTGSPFNLGIDFTGGVNFTINVEKATTEFNTDGKLSEQTRGEITSLIRKTMNEAGVSSLQLTTMDKYLFSLKFQQIENISVDELAKKLTSTIEGTTILGTDFIGPSVGHELQTQSLTILGVAILLLLIYITLRFEFWAAIAAILALIHDVLIVLGLTALLHIEINTAYVAALLTVLGYSINDTIVIFDRIRENLKENKDELVDIINSSVDQSITRSINTSFTTLAVLLSIFLFGGASIKDFALVLLIGISFGTYSSIFIASPLLYRFKMLNQ
ncbi:MAG: protein translocase subunit SecF [Candidatus Margulisbacteria bacterium]|nr:protein translocase subunit SecF [Candidatus Margulisiibacteriota bacterium]